MPADKPYDLSHVGVIILGQALPALAEYSNDAPTACVANTLGQADLLSFPANPLAIVGAEPPRKLVRAHVHYSRKFFGDAAPVECQSAVNRGSAARFPCTKQLHKLPQRGKSDDHVDDPAEDRALSEDRRNEIEVQSTYEAPIQSTDDDQEQSDDVRSTHANSPGRGSAARQAGEYESSLFG